MSPHRTRRHDRTRRRVAVTSLLMALALGGCASWNACQVPMTGLPATAGPRRRMSASGGWS